MIVFSILLPIAFVFVLRAIMPHAQDEDQTVSARRQQQERRDEFIRNNKNRKQVIGSKTILDQVEQGEQK